MKTPITYYGGKQLMVRHILPNIPPHRLYCEPFIGGAAVFFAKPKSEVEVINDLNHFVTNFYEQSKNNFDKLQVLVKATLHSRRAFERAKVIYEHPDMFTPLRKAWAFWVICNQSFSSNFSSWGYGVKENKSELRVHNKRLQFLAQISERLEIVQIECRDAVDVIKSRDREDSFFYCDPPYYNADMGPYSWYRYEDYKALLDALANLKGKFLLSSYHSDILAQYTKDNGWNTLEVKGKVTVSQKRKPKVEVLTSNYPISITLPNKV